jgi:plastocyanin
MFIFLLFALASADADNLNLIPDADDGLDTDALVPILPAAQVHLVSWQIPTAPNHITINVGDSVQFTWTGMHGLVMFSDANGASACAVNNAISLAPIANGGVFTWLANAAGDFYFACPVDGGRHCLAGMNLWVTVVNPALLPLAVSGSLAINWESTVGCTICGASCLMPLINTLGVCNANLNCMARTLIPPICGTTCPLLACGIPPICAAGSYLFNPLDVNNCPTCPICTASSCVGAACLPCCPLVVPLGFSCRAC